MRSCCIDKHGMASVFLGIAASAFGSDAFQNCRAVADSWRDHQARGGEEMGILQPRNRKGHGDCTLPQLH